MMQQLQNRMRRIGVRSKARWGSRFGQRYLRQGDVTHIELDIRKFAYMGFGASMGWLQAGYLASDALQARLTVLNPDQWPFGGASAECAMDRFIQFPEADIVDVPVAHAVPMESCDFENLARWGYHDALDWPTCLFGYKPDGYATLEDYRRAVFKRCYQLTEFAQTNIEPQLGFLPKRYIAWHVRRGDKVSGIWREDDPIGLHAYSASTLDILSQDPDAPRDIVLCTDDETIVQEVTQLPEVLSGEITLHYDDQEKRWNGYCALQREGKISDTGAMVMEVLTAQKVVEIFRRAEYLVGCNSSCLFRLGALLQDKEQHVRSLSENKVFKKYYPM